MTINPSLMDDSAVSRQWPIFRDSQVNIFLRVFAQKRIEELRTQLENGDGDVARIRGQLAEWRMLVHLLQGTGIETIVNDIRKFYGR